MLFRSYATTLRNATRREDAAFNYEYLVRVRTQLEKEKGKQVSLPLVQPDGPYGRGSTPNVTGDLRKFKVLIPLQADEPTESGAGKAKPMQRKG